MNGTIMEYTVYTGCAKKNNPLGKIHYPNYCNRFFTKFTAFTDEDLGHISSKFRCNTCYGVKSHISGHYLSKYSTDYQVASILVVFSSDTSDTPDFLVTF